VRGLLPSREQAREAVAAGRVLVGGAPAGKPGRLVAAGEPVVVTGPPRRFASRGGEKLAAALVRFHVDPGGRRALDAGASTGGFTDCLLQGGARQVVALDVGRGQLDLRLRADSRVVCMEGTNLRQLTLAQVGGERFDLVTADLSFISLGLVAPLLLGELAIPGADALLLVKPQFEAGRREVSRGRGVVRDPEVWQRALEAVASAVTGCGAAMMGVMASPLPGTSGNVEFFLHARAHGGAGGGHVDLAGAVGEGRELVAGRGE
jgi:23S rRNA (cytidine1920-2'-O)/16S rRNA (cytidine1409-2'-O)-methyltransferase